MAKRKNKKKAVPGNIPKDPQLEAPKGAHARPDSGSRRARRRRKNRTANMAFWGDMSEVPKKNWAPPPRVVPAQMRWKNTNHVISQYGMRLSTERLDNIGFHPDVTFQRPEDVIDDWERMKARRGNLPTKDQLEAGAFSFNGVKYSNSSKQLTRGLLHLRGQFLDNRSETVGLPSEATSSRSSLLEILLDNSVVRAQLVPLIFKMGVSNVQNLAVATNRAWDALLMDTCLWDFNTATFRHDKGANGVFLVLNPEYTTGEIHGVRGHLDVDVRLMKRREDEALWLYRFRCWVRECFRASPTGQARGNGSGFTQEVLRICDFVVGQQKAFDLEDHDQFKKPGKDVYRPLMYTNMKRLQQMVRQVHEKSATIEVLYFEKTPLLDRRILAIILRECSTLTTIGIYDCPMIHFGDIVCILDLIHEINCERKQAGKPVIKGLDFSPRFHCGPSFEHASSDTFGLTWTAHSDRDTIQRGMYMIIMKAVLKSKAMGISLLFDKNSAFVRYLAKIPTQPLGIPSFLSALYRYLELSPHDAGFQDLKMKTLYDLLKPIRLGLENPQLLQTDWTKYYMALGDRPLMFCASCGYATLQEFFSPEMQGARSLYRVCAGCFLQRKLSNESDHLKVGKQAALDHLFPDYDNRDFNMDAPIPRKAANLFRLESTVSVRPLPPLTVNAQGEMTAPEYEEPLIRDRKSHVDSVQNLPTLTALIEQSEWLIAEMDADVVDKFRCALMDYEKKFPGGLRKKEDFWYFRHWRMDHQSHDTWDELQPLGKNRVGLEQGVLQTCRPNKDSFGLKEAADFFQKMNKWGWGQARPAVTVVPPPSVGSTKHYSGDGPPPPKFW